MPDLLSHLVIGLILAEILNIRKKSLVILGAILPDLIFKLSLLNYFIPMPPGATWLLFPFHGPFGLGLLLFIITPIFRYDFQKTFFALLIGGYSHLLFDLLVRHFEGGTMLFFPLSWQFYRLDVIWADQFYFVLVPAVLTYFGIILYKKYAHKS